MEGNGSGLFWSKGGSTEKRLEMPGRISGLQLEIWNRSFWIPNTTADHRAMKCDGVIY